MTANPPNRGGTGPHTSKQGKSGPIIKTWTLGSGSNSKGTKSVHAPHRVGSSPSKSKSSWYLGGKKKK